jgi:hypothetical protein
MIANIFNLVENRKQIEKFMASEKANGIKKAYYMWHFQANDITAFDTREMFNNQVELYLSNGLKLSKSMNRDGMCGVKKATMHVFRHEDETKHFGMEALTLGFDYLPADCEMIIMEVTHVLPPSTKKKKKR